MRACHAAGPGWIAGRDQFPGRGFFRDFSSPVRQMTGSFRPTMFPECHLAIIIILLISALLQWVSEWVSEWCVSSLMFVLSRNWPRYSVDHLSGEALHVFVWTKKYVRDSEIVPSPDRSWFCKDRRREIRKSVYKGEVKLWQWMNEKR